MYAGRGPPPPPPIPNHSPFGQGFAAPQGDPNVIRTLSQNGPIDDHEVKLFNTAAEEEDWERLGSLFAIITAIDRLENVYIKGGIDPDEYESACRKLLGQFKTLSRALSSLAPDPLAFMDEYQMHCPQAKEVIQFGEPSTVRFRVDQPGQNDDDSVAALSLGTSVVTLKDALTMGLGDPDNMLACDNIQPYVKDVLNHVSKVRLPPSFDNSRLLGWVEKLNKLQAYESLTENEARQLMADMDDLQERIFAALEQRNRGRSGTR